MDVIIWHLLNQHFFQIMIPINFEISKVEIYDYSAFILLFCQIHERNILLTCVFSLAYTIYFYDISPNFIEDKIAMHYIWNSKVVNSKSSCLFFSWQLIMTCNQHTNGIQIYISFIWNYDLMYNFQCAMNR